MDSETQPRGGFKAVLALPRTVWLIGLISLVNDSSSEMLYPLIPLYLSSVLMAGPRVEDPGRYLRLPFLADEIALALDCEVEMAAPRSKSQLVGFNE